MSLLMDALKRAEASKQETGRNAGTRAAQSESEPLTLAAIPPENPPSKPLPDLAHYLDAVDAELLSQVNPGELTDELPDDVNRQAARNVFAAKLPSTASPSRHGLRFALILLGLAGIGIAGYFWYALNQMGQSALSAKPNNAVAPLSPATPRPPAPSPSQAIATQTPSPSPQPAVIFAPREERRPMSTDAQQPVDTASTSVRLTKTPPHVDASALRGYGHLQRGELELARRDYEQSLLREPNNTETLLALAAIAAAQGRHADAQTLRQRAMIANPTDPATQAAMLGGVGSETDPQGTESRLRTLLAAQPESAPLNFALGNLLARQSRWREAQEAYFNAVAADGDNPDYFFNLAISLDQLRQSRLASQHYRLALEAAGRRPASFERGQVERRLAELQTVSQP